MNDSKHMRYSVLNNECCGDQNIQIKDQFQSVEASCSSSESESHSRKCYVPLKKARFIWQVKNHRHQNLGSKVLNGIICKKSQHKRCTDANIVLQSTSSCQVTPSQDECGIQSSSKKFKTDTDNDLNNQQTQSLCPTSSNSRDIAQIAWSQSRSSPVGILLNSMDQVLEIAHQQLNSSINIESHQMKHVMKGITDNSINEILEATGNAPGKRKPLSQVNCENLEDQAVSEVIRQHGLHPSITADNRCLKKSLESEKHDGLDFVFPQTKSPDVSSPNEMNDPEISSDVSATSKPAFNANDAFDYPGVSTDDVLDAAVFSAITEKGIGILNT